MPGAGQGLAFYLEPKWAELAKPETWRWAFGQMFFSMSLAFGVMITYASFLHRKSDINNNAAIIGLADMGTSFIAGIAVFATLGGMSFATQAAGAYIPVEKVVASGPGMSFVAFPYALAQLPYSAWFGAVFFIALMTLGIDSAFSITESVLASLLDKTGWGRNKTLIGLSLVGLGIGLVYCTRGGLSWLGAMDDFINSTWGGIALLGLLECVVLGWTYRIGRLREHANELSDWKLGRWWDFIIRYFAPVILSALFVWSLLEKASATGGFLHDNAGDLNWPVVVGLAFAILAPVLSVVLSLVHSPGADTHAAYKPGQPRSGRGLGFVGIVLLVLALAGTVAGFARALGPASRLAEAKNNEKVLTDKDEIKKLTKAELEGVWKAACEKTQAAKSTVGPAESLLWPAGGLALLATLIGAFGVGRAEKTRRRPSTLARTSAGIGVMSLGACVGTPDGHIPHNKPPRAGGRDIARSPGRNHPAGLGVGRGDNATGNHRAPEPTTAKTQPAATTGPSSANEPREMSWPSYLVLAVMVTLIVVGLLWCFYRAIKASGGEAPEQVAENDDTD